MNFVFPALAILMLSFAAIVPSAYSQTCANPDGPPGKLFYSSDYGVLQVCTPKGWASLHPPACPDGDGCNPAVPCETGPIGTRCTIDGAIYAGDTIGGARMYAAACDHGMSWDGTTCIGAQIFRQWKTASTTTAGTTSLTDGVVNTNAMATAGIALHPAAQACRNVGTEWYLPAPDELYMLYVNLARDEVDAVTPGDSFGFNRTGSNFAGWYWPSSQGGISFSTSRRFSDGAFQNYGKMTEMAVRCVRR